MLGCESSASEDSFDTLLAASAARFPHQNYKSGLGRNLGILGEPDLESRGAFRLRYEADEPLSFGSHSVVR